MTLFAIGLKDKFSIHFYVHAVIEILGRPRKFFSELPATIGGMQSLGFLMLSALFFCAVRLMNTRPQALFLVGGIHLLNAVGMVFIMAALGYLVMTLSFGNKAPFTRLFSIYALCTGVTLLVSWIPYFVVFTEPWKWYLIGVGLIKGCGLKIKEAVLIIILSLTIWILFYWSLIGFIKPGTLHPV